MDSVLILNKPKGLTSHDVVNRLRRLLGTRRIGHTGTLDPMAEGLLLCCVNRATRIVPWLTGLPKTYTGEMVLGAQSDTYDAEGIIECVADPSGITEEDLLKGFESQKGLIEQKAPPYSAVKVNGKKLYEYARAGKKAPEKIRTVWVERFELLRYLTPKALFEAKVGSGTYIRALAHDVGHALGCGAYLSALCRTQIGAFELENAVALEDLEKDPEEMLPRATLSLPDALSHMTKVTLMPQAEQRLRHGGSFGWEEVLNAEILPPQGEPVLALTEQGEALAITQCESEGDRFYPLRVLASPES